MIFASGIAYSCLVFALTKVGACGKKKRHSEGCFAFVCVRILMKARYSGSVKRWLANYVKVHKGWIESVIGNE